MVYFFLYIQNHLHWSDTTFFLEDLFQLLSSQPEQSLEVKGILTDLYELKDTPTWMIQQFAKYIIKFKGFS